MTIMLEAAIAVKGAEGRSSTLADLEQMCLINGQSALAIDPVYWGLGRYYGGAFIGGD